MNILFTICARAGSKGVSNKNIKEFLHYPLAYYTVASYLLFCKRYQENYGHIELAVNTDSKELIKQLEKIPVSFRRIKREETLADDFAAKVDVLKDTLLKTEKQSHYTYDLLVDLDLTSPIRMVYDIEGVIETVIKDEHCDVAFSMTDARRNPYFNMVKAKTDGYLGTVIESDFVARQQTPVCYDMNASIYAYKKAFLLKEKKTLFDGNALGWAMLDTGVLDIDSANDHELLQVIAKHLFDTEENYGEIFSCVQSFMQRQT